jgi:hypothetical protein
MTFLADSILLGFKSSASILQEISKAITISIPFFCCFCETFVVFGFANINIKLINIKNSKNVFK